MVQYVKHKDFISSLQKMRQQGGQPHKKADKARLIFDRAVDGEPDPFHGVPLTNNGESRIQHARKYDLGDAYRMITVQDDKICVFCYVGNHDSCDKWIISNAGLTTVKNERGEYELVFASSDIKHPDGRTTGESDYAVMLLADRLEGQDLEQLISVVPPKLMKILFKLDTSATDNQLYDFAIQIDDTTISGFVYDVLIALRAGDRNKAIARIALHYRKSIPIEELSSDEIVEISDGAAIKKLKVGSPEYAEWFSRFINASGYQDWMLFMHPAQQKIVDDDYAGSAKLSGVSGSGKTCIIVNRAIRLAKNTQDKPVLVLTLNKSLAMLIQELLLYACPDDTLRKKIVVRSFFELCQEYLNRFEPENNKLHNDVTWKNNEHIDEVWREYYRCESNNTDAEVLFPIHKSLNAQGINPEDYLRQELDWVRSAFSEGERDKYLEDIRIGRAIGFLPQRRKLIMQGLEGWENKMTAIGVIDYLGLSTKLSRHLDKLNPEYSAILVDEVQDFGTIELNLVRQLVADGRNDIFLCGDMTQHVLPKHQSFRDAGIIIPGARSLKIKRNYRNSREILRAAYEVFIPTMHGDITTDSDIDILDPEYANFSTPKPDVLKADSLDEEIAYALTQMEESAKNDHNFKGCIAIAGFSFFEIKQFADIHKLTILDGTRGLQNGSLFLSDLEQTKGYEFDIMCILNATKLILPPADMPVEEQYRDACRLYVAMTRAKRQLILSYSGDVSPWIYNDGVKQYFEFAAWESYVDLKKKNMLGSPNKMPQFVTESDISLGSLTGHKYLYTKDAIGLSLELQEKLDELVNGVNLTRGDKQLSWLNIRSALADVKKHPYAKQAFGLERWKEFVERVKV